MKLSRALSDLVKYTRSVGLYDIEAQGELCRSLCSMSASGNFSASLRNQTRLCVVPAANCSWQVSSLSETKAHQVMQQKATSFIHFNQRQLSRIYPSSYRVDSSNFNPQPFWNAGCQLGKHARRPTSWSFSAFRLLAESSSTLSVQSLRMFVTTAFDFSGTQLPVRGPGAPAQQSQVLQ